jgi:catechol 2,3-dioxygenase-like lactoylglutathione lyase family enzyme
MLNHVLWLPGSTEKVMVVTEGLTDESIFRRYLEEYGAGVHHVAYAVDDIEAALEQLRARGVHTTSEQILRDPVSGLRQIFIAREHCGYFLELIERGDATSAGNFVEDNMAALANTMHQYLDPVESASAVADPFIVIPRPMADVMLVMVDPFRLPEWTGHRMIRAVAGGVVEARMHGDLALSVASDATGVDYTWRRGAASKTVRLDVTSALEGTRVSASLEGFPMDARASVAEILAVELRALAAVVEEQPERISIEDREQLDAWHLVLHQREGL